MNLLFRLGIAGRSEKKGDLSSFFLKAAKGFQGTLVGPLKNERATGKGYTCFKSCLANIAGTFRAFAPSNLSSAEDPCL